MASRSRPRSAMAKEEMGDELNLWNAIVDKIKSCQKLNEEYESIASGVPAIEKQMQLDSAPAKEAIARLEELEKIQREGVRLAEKELKILNEEPENLLQNLETLISVLSAFEAEPPPPKINTNPKQRPKRKIETDGANDSPLQTPETATPAPNSASRQISKNASRSTSVAATSAKSENGAAEAEQSIIKPMASSTTVEKPLTKIKGEGKQRRYEILDTEPEPDTVPETVSPLSLVAIPPPGTAVHEIVKSQQVFALYPETSTFYRAEVVSMKGNKKDHCRLRFEGEEEKGKEQEVERRYVLDVKRCEK